MRVASPPRLLAAVFALVALGAALMGCGKNPAPLPARGAKPGPTVPASGPAAATKNTIRLAGVDPAGDAAAVARAVYPGLTAASRPQAVVLVNERDWPASLAASVLATTGLGAPVLYADGNALPAATVQALQALRPLGAPSLGGSQVIRIGTSAGVPEGLRTRQVPTAGDPASTAAAVEQLLGIARGGAPHEVLVVAADAAPALNMPAAGLSAESGVPILFVDAAGVPAATSAALTALGRPAIFLLGPSAVSSAAQAGLARLGTVTPIAEAGAAGAGGPVENAITVARFTNGAFGWGVKEPGHGLVFANAARPLDAPAAALLSASGDYGPLLLLDSPSQVPSALARYLADIQPAYGSAPQFRPVRGAYNHGWLIGDESAISAVTQAEIDSMLEIAPRKTSAPESPVPPGE